LVLRPNAEQYQFLHAFSAGMQGMGDAATIYETMRGLSEKATVFGAERMLGQIALRDDRNDVARRHFKAAIAAQKDDHIAQRELRRL
jgi:hypothetical protein